MKKEPLKTKNPHTSETGEEGGNTDPGSEQTHKSNNESVSLGALWRFASGSQKFQLFLGCLFSLLHGLGDPVSQYVFSSAFDSMSPSRSLDERERLVLKDSRNSLYVALIYTTVASLAFLIWTSLA